MLQVLLYAGRVFILRPGGAGVFKIQEMMIDMNLTLQHSRSYNENSSLPTSLFSEPYRSRSRFRHRHRDWDRDRVR